MRFKLHRRLVVAGITLLAISILLLVWFGFFAESARMRQIRGLVHTHGGAFSRQRRHVGEPGLNPDWTWIYRVDLSGKPISDDVVKAVLHRLLQLQFKTVAINLKGTRITDAVVPDLKAIHSLEVIDVSETSISPVGLAELRRNSPSWQLVVGDLGPRELPVTGVEQVRFSPDGHLLAIVSRSGMDSHAEVWEVESRQKLSKVGKNVYNGALTFSPDSTRLAVADVSSAIIIDVHSGETLDDVNPPAGLESIAFSADGQALHVQTRDGTQDGFFRYLLADGTYQPLGGRIVRRDGSTHFLENGEFTVVTVDGKSHPWSIPPFPTNGGKQLAMAGDGESLVLYDWYADEKQGSVLLCRRNPPSQLRIPVESAGQPPRPLGNVVFNWTSQQFAYPTNNMITIWSVESGELLATHHIDFVPRAVSFSADGKTLAVGGHRVELLDTIPE